MIDNTHKNVHFKNKTNGEIPRSGVIDQKNPNGLYYHCSKVGPEYLFGKLKIRDCRKKPYFPGKMNKLSC